MGGFRSFLSPQISDFIRYRKTSQNWSDCYERNLASFDRHCHDHYPDATTLTPEMANGWCRQRGSESGNSCRARVYVVIDFISFLNSRGLSEVPAPQPPRQEKCTYVPHAFTEDELSRFFHECDSIRAIGNRPGTQVRKLTVPVYFRLLYSSGIRMNEARLLLKEDVGLGEGILSIRHSKGHDQHYIVLHDSMRDVMRGFDVAIEKVVPRRKYFFASPKDSCFYNGWATKNFMRLWYQVNTAHATAYDFRHNYAVLNINCWVGQGLDFYDKPVYLSKSMGHRSLESTKYYYSIVPALSEAIEAQAGNETDWMIPEVANLEESN